MRPRHRLLAARAACGVLLALAGCGEATTPVEPVAETVEAPLPEVPDTNGETVDAAQASIEEGGFSVSFDGDEPSDPSSCTVEDQDLVGDADEGADVTLTVTCDVPDVTGEDGQSAVDALEAAGFTWAVDDCFDTLSECTVGDQDYSEAQPGDEVSLTMELPEPAEPPDPPEPAGPTADGCHESYPDDCLDGDAYDYDCEGGEGDGPEYVVGPVTVDHAVSDPDPFDLDRDGDGTGCDGY